MLIKFKGLVTTDDLNQEDWSLFKHFDEIKEEFPDFQLLAFFTPFWKIKQENFKIDLEKPEDIIKPEFMKFLQERKDWLSLGSHGLFHHVAEYSADLKFQKIMFSISKTLKEYLNSQGIKFQSVCKPPFYKWNEISFSLSKEFGFDQLFIRQGIFDFISNRLIPREKLNLVDSHVSVGCPMPDRIDLFKDKLRDILSGKLKDSKKFHYD